MKLPFGSTSRNATFLSPWTVCWKSGDLSIRIPTKERRTGGFNGLRCAKSDVQHWAKGGSIFGFTRKHSGTSFVTSQIWDFEPFVCKKYQTFLWTKTFEILQDQLGYAHNRSWHVAWVQRFDFLPAGSSCALHFGTTALHVCPNSGHERKKNASLQNGTFFGLRDWTNKQEKPHRGHENEC